VLAVVSPLLAAVLVPVAVQAAVPALAQALAHPAPAVVNQQADQQVVTFQQMGRCRGAPRGLVCGALSQTTSAVAFWGGWIKTPNAGSWHVTGTARVICPNAAEAHAFMSQVELAARLHQGRHRHPTPRPLQIRCRAVRREHRKGAWAKAAFRRLVNRHCQSFDLSPACNQHQLVCVEEGMTDHTRPATSRRNALAGLGAAMLAPATPTMVHASTASIDSSYGRLLSRYVVVGRDGLNRIAYGRWKANAADMTALSRIISQYEAVAASTLPRDARFAFWVNLYNALTLKVVLEAFPVRSIRSIGGIANTGPWRQRLVSVEGRRMSLDDIEHRTLRTGWQEPRVHYAVNCASIGCPNLQPRPWAAATLNRDLDAAARTFINSPRGLQISAPGQVRVSSIYHWFKEDFGGNDAGVLAHLRSHASPELLTRLQGVRIAGHDYDWAINSTN
jgi:hypothetical protein